MSAVILAFQELGSSSMMKRRYSVTETARNVLWNLAFDHIFKRRLQARLYAWWLTSCEVASPHQQDDSTGEVMHIGMIGDLQWTKCVWVHKVLCSIISNYISSLNWLEINKRLTNKFTQSFYHSQAHINTHNIFVTGSCNHRGSKYKFHRLYRTTILIP